MAQPSLWCDFRYKALESGATDFLISPVDHHEFRTRVRNLLTLRRQQEIIRKRALTLEEKLVLTNKLRIEASAWRGRPISFRIAGPWTVPGRMNPARPGKRSVPCFSLEDSDATTRPSSDVLFADR